jgi:hypothetical protein
VPAITGTYVLTFGDFGGPVVVTTSPASQVGDTIAPYWVFTTLSPVSAAPDQAARAA